MPKNESMTKEVLCSHQKIIKTNNKSYIYCSQCGCISINLKNNSFFTLKPKSMENEIEIDPVQIVKEMKKNQESNFPFLTNDYNINNKEDPAKIKKIKENIVLYLSKRKTLLLYLQNITKTLNYSDLSFYHCLLDIDLYLSQNITEKMTDEDLIYYLIGFFLNSSKFKETDIYEPELYIFCNSDADYYLNKELISYYEAKCLKLMGYNFFCFSTYDWLNTFMGIGYLFQGEIDTNNSEAINDINTYAFKLLVIITPKKVFFKYSPLYIAISIVQICREDKIKKDKINKELFNKLLSLYNLSFKDYETCYNEIKYTLENDNSEKISAYSSSSKKDKIKKNKTLGEMNYDQNDSENSSGINKFEKKIIKFDTSRKLNLKKNFRDSFQLKLFNANCHIRKNKTPEILHFKSSNHTNNKNTIKRQKTLQIVEYMLDNLPKIGEENSNKRLKTDDGLNIRNENRYLTIKNDIVKNNNIKNKKNKNKSGNSLDMKLLIKKEKSPLRFNNFTRNVTFDALKNKENESNKKIRKNKTNNNNALNKSNETTKYVKTNPNININIKNNINIFFELKDKEKNKKNFKFKNNNNNLEINIFKNNNFIMKNNNTGVKLKANQKDTKILQDKINNIKIIKKEIKINKDKKDEIMKENKTIPFEKNILKNEMNSNNNNIINAKGKKFVFTQYNKKMANAKDLLNKKKENFQNQRLPRLKLKLNK